MLETVVDNTGFGDWQLQLIKNERNRLLDLRENAYLIMKHHPMWKERVAFDEFAQRVILRDAPELPGFAKGEWTMEHDLNFGLWCAQMMKCPFKNEKTIAQGVAMAAFERRVHPVREWIGGLEWDGIERLDLWLAKCLGVEDTPYAAAAGRFFMLNLVARVFEPGCICRTVIVLEGPQLRGKSEALRALAEPWFSDSHLDLGSKDSFLQIQGVLLYEMQEMHAVAKAEINQVKQFISSREDNFRPPYSARVVRIKRQVVIAGTANESLYLRDWTGGTRFHPVKVDPDKVDPGLISSLREQLFAEAYARWKKGERRHPTHEEQEQLFAPEQDERTVGHPWIAMIEEWLDRVIDGPENPERVTTNEILTRCLHFERSKLLDSHEQTVGRIMARLDWGRRRASAGSKRGYFYVRPKRRPES